MKHQVKIRFTIKYVYIGLALIIIGGLITFYFLNKSNISFGLLEIIAYVTGATATLTLMYHAFNLENQILTQENNTRILKSKYTYDVISKWNEVPMTQSATKTMNLIKDPDRAKELDDPAKLKEFDSFLNQKENVEMKRDLLLVLNYFETIAIMVERDHIDSNIIKSSFRTVFTEYYTRLKHFIDYKQNSAPRTWCSYEKLVKTWIEKSKETS